MYSVMKAMSYSQYVLYANIILAYLTNCSRGYCSLENLYLNNTEGYISTPPYQKSQNICDFQPGVCFIFKPDKIDCEILHNATTTCTHKIWFTGKDAYPPKVLFESDNHDYKDWHIFKIKYSYVAYNNDSVSTTDAAFISSTQKPDQATRGTSQFSLNAAATVTLGRVNHVVYENSKGQTTESLVVIILGILCGILAIALILSAVRLHTTHQKLKKSKTIDLNDISNNDSPVEEVNDIPIYSEVNKQKKNKRSVSDEKLVVDNELYNAL
ncbi:uncharacterized protein LOC120334256 [Styela clava]